MWVVVLSFAGGAEVIRSAPMALPDAEAQATQLNTIGGLTASLCAAEPVRDPRVEDREDVLGWAIFTGAEGDDPGFHAFFTDMAEADGYLATGPSLCDPVIVPACVMRVRFGVDDVVSGAHEVLAATGTGGHPGAKRFLEAAELAAWSGKEKG